MKKVKIIVNPFLEPGDEPGKFFEFDVIIPDFYTAGQLERKVFNKLRYTVESETTMEENANTTAKHKIYNVCNRTK